MQAWSRRSVLAGTAAAIGLAAGSKPAGAQTSTTLRMAVPSDFTTLDPAFIADETGSLIIDAVLPKLITYRPGGSWDWELMIAQSLEPLDAKTVRFRLRPGLQWSDGFGPITAEDVQFTFERVIDPALASPYSADWEKLEGVEVVDALTGIIRLKEPFSPLFTSSLPWDTGTIVSKRAVMQIGGRLGTEMPACGGPYRLAQWRPKQQIVLERNPAWDGPPPGFERVIVLPIDDQKAAELAFESREIDFTEVSASSLPRLRASPPADAELQEFTSLFYFWLGMNVQKPPFTDPRVRRAVKLAIDVDGILEAAFFGAATRATGAIPKGLIGHRDRGTPGRDVEQARALLSEADLAGGFDCTLDTINRTDWRTAAEVIQGNLAEIGIGVTINPSDAGSFWSLGDDSQGDYAQNMDLTLKEYYAAPDPSWVTVWFTCNQIGLYNWERWCNDEVDRLQNEGVVEQDPAKREAIYQRMGELMEESDAFVFITYPPKAAMHRSSVVPANLPNGRPRIALFRPA